MWRVRLAIIVSAVLLTMMSVFIAHAQKTSYIDLYKKGYDLWEQSEYDLAIQNFDRVLAVNPSLSEAYFYRALSKIQMLDYKGAIVDYSIYLELRPENKDLLLSRARLFLKTGRFKQAKLDLERMRFLPPGETNVIYFKKPLYGKGITGVQTAEGVKDEEILNYLGQAEYGLENYLLAKYYFDSVIVISPNNADYYVNRGLAYQQLKQLDKSEQDYEKALALDYLNESARYNLATLKEITEGVTEAGNHFDELIANNPNSPVGYRKRAYNYLKQSNYEPAIEDLKKSIDLEPKAPYTWMNLGIAYSGIKSWERALNSYSSAIELKPNMAEAYLNRGNLFYQLQQYDDALNNYNVAILYDFNYGLAYYHRGITYYKIDKPLKACEDLDRAVKSNVSIARKVILEICPTHRDTVK